MVNKPKCVKATTAFNKATLRKTELALFDNGIYQVTSKILDRDTLIVTVITSHYTKPSMHALAGMYMREFMRPEDMVFEDWAIKSDIKKENKMKTKIICIWRDESWCYIDKIEEYTGMSDDYKEVHVDASWSDDQICEFIELYDEFGK